MELCKGVFVECKIGNDTVPLNTLQTALQTYERDSCIEARKLHQRINLSSASRALAVTARQ